MGIYQFSGLDFSKKNRSINLFVAFGTFYIQFIKVELLTLGHVFYLVLLTFEDLLEEFFALWGE